MVQAISEKRVFVGRADDQSGTGPVAGEEKNAMLGLETPGVHPVESEKAHKILLKAEIVIVESLAKLNKLKKENIFFVAAPLKIKGRDGSPVRAMAIDDMPSYR